MEKLPTIVLPDGREFSGERCEVPPKRETSIRRARASLLRLGGIRFQCEKPQHLVREFYVKCLGMQELSLQVGLKPGHTKGSLEFRLLQTPNKNSLGCRDIVTQCCDGRTVSLDTADFQRHLRESSSSTPAREPIYGSRSASHNSLIEASHVKFGFFAAFSFFPDHSVKTNDGDSTAQMDGMKTQPTTPFQIDWYKRAFSQFVLEFIPIQTSGVPLRAYTHRNTDTFSRLTYSVSDVDRALVDLLHHMVRIEPAGQFLDLSYAASFLDPRNFRGRLLQCISEYSMVPRRAVANICKSLDQRQSAEDTQSVQTGDNAGETNETNETDWSSVHALRYPQSKYRGDVIKEAEVVQAELDGCLPVSISDADKDELMSGFTSCAHPTIAIGAEIMPEVTPPILHHIELHTGDTDKTFRFYEEVLGMTLIERKVAADFGFELCFFSFETPLDVSEKYWLWQQKFTSICFKVLYKECEKPCYSDLCPNESGFLGMSFLCHRKDETRFLEHLSDKGVQVDTVKDEIYGCQVISFRDPQNIPIRIVFIDYSEQA